MTINWNNDQKEIFRVLETERGDLVIEANAGTGKSTVFAEGIRRLVQNCGKKNILCGAFNTSTKIEMGDKLQKHGLNWKQANSKSLNGMGSKLVKQSIPGTTLVKGRTRRLARKVVCKDLGQDYEMLFAQQWSNLPAKALEMRRHIAEIAGAVDDLAARAKGTLTPWTDDLKLAQLAERARIASSGVDISLLAAYARMTLVQCIEELSEHDFDDQIWLPHALNLEPSWKHSFVFIDEAQDMNPAQIELAHKHVNREWGGRLVAIGDSNQAIYGWRGADSGILRRMAEKATMRKLTDTYRCGENIAAECRQWVPDFESVAGYDGEVEYGSDGTAELAVPGDFIISRTNAPLTPLCFSFIKRGIAAKVAGRGLVEGLEAMIENSGAKTTDELLVWIDKWCDREKRVFIEKEDDEGAALVEDKAEVVRTLAYEADDVAGVSTLLEETFTSSNDENVVLLSTVHRAKGMERDNVYILGDTFARTGGEEDNIRYVAASRAKHRLIYCGRPLTEEPPIGELK